MNSTDEKPSQTSTDVVHPRHILAPVDFSKPCLHGISAAVDLARRFGAKLTIVHVVKHLPHGSHVALEVAGISQDWERPAREKLAEFVTAHVPSDVNVNEVVLHGKPFHEVVNLAAEQRCDLIVIATHGYTGLAHLLMGSNAERIVQHAPCAVLVVRGRPDDDTPPAASEIDFRWILLPTDFSENSCKAFPLATAMAHEYRAKLTLAYVVPPMPAPIAMPNEIPYVDWGNAMMSQRADAEAQLRKFRAERFSAETKMDTVVFEGPAHLMITEAAKSDTPGLIVIATNGQTGWEHALLGSTAERVVRHAPCPVLVIR